MNWLRKSGRRIIWSWIKNNKMQFVKFILRRYLRQNLKSLEKLEKKSLDTFIYVGKPTAEFRKKLGNESRIQLNDSYAEVAEIQDYIIGERASMKEEDQPQMTVSLKVDQDTKMGIVTDIKEALRKAYALKINYSAQPRQ